jgi:prepilin-type N-terminal cleavage/methylation domain-containing protein
MMKTEHGFTMVELLVAVAILGLISSVIGVAIEKMLTVPEYGDDRITAMHELQNVAHWFGRDGQMAIDASGGEQLVLTLADNATVSYTLEGRELHRIAGTSNRTLAGNIASASFSIQDRLITMNITSAPEGRWGASENGTYQVCLRPAPE